MWAKKSQSVKYKRARVANHSKNTFVFQGQHYSSFTTSTTSDEETSFTVKKPKRKKPKS